MGNAGSNPTSLKAGLWDLMQCTDMTVGVSTVSKIVSGWDMFVLLGANADFVEAVAEVSHHQVFTEGYISLLYHQDLALNPLGSYEYNITGGSLENSEDCKKVMVVEIEWQKYTITVFVADFVLQNSAQEDYAKNEVMKKILATVEEDQRALFFVSFNVESYCGVTKKSDVTTVVQPNLFDECCTNSEWGEVVFSGEATTIWSFKPKSGIWDNVLYHKLRRMDSEVLVQPQQALLSSHHPVRATFTFQALESSEEETSSSSEADL